MKEIKLTSGERRLLNRLKSSNHCAFTDKITKSGQGLLDKALIKLTAFGNLNYELTDIGREF